jgi:hypothetical protein
MYFNFSLSISILVLQPLDPSSWAHQTRNRAVPFVGPQWGGSGLRKPRGTIAPCRSWGPRQASSQTPPPPKCRIRWRLCGPDSAQSGTRRRASPREQSFKLIHDIWSCVNNHSLPLLRGRLWRRAPIYFRFHRPARGAGSGGTMISLRLALYAIMFIELCFNFISVFCIFIPHVVS